MVILVTISDFVLNKILLLGWDSLWFWRILSFIAILVLILTKGRLFVNKEIIIHDKEIYQKSKQIMSDEKLHDILNEIYGEHLENSYFDILNEYRMFFKPQDNKYLSKKLDRVSSNVLSSLDNLLKYISLHFDIRKNNQRFIFFEPHKKDSGKYMDELRGLRDERNNLLDSDEEKFSNYIKLKRNILKI